MGRRMNDQTAGLVAWPIMLLFMTFGWLYMRVDLRFNEFNWSDWLLVLATLFMVSILMYLCSRKERFGWIEILLFNFLAGSYFPIMILNSLEGLNVLVRDNGDPMLFGPGELILFTGFAFFPTIISSILILIFAERDPLFKEGKLFLPISFWKEIFNDETRIIYPQDIKAVYPRWVASPGKSKGLKQPEYHGKRIFGYGIKLRNGKRYGFSLFSRAFLNKDLIEFLGEKEFKRRRKDHAFLSDQEWKELRRRGEHWYTSLEAPLLLFMIFNMVTLFITGAIMVTLQNSNLMPPMVIIILALTFMPSLIILLKKMEAHHFYKGTIFRMQDREEELPSWLKITSNQLTTIRDEK